MIYKSVSIKEIIGKVIRDTRIQDPSYIIDMHEWIPEAMAELRTQYELTNYLEEVKVEFHKGKMPCNLQTLLAVEHNGARMRYTSRVKNTRTNINHYYEQQVNGSQIFNSVIYAQKTNSYPGDQYPSDPNTIANTQYWWSTAVPSKLNNYDDSTYTIEMNYINTSFRDGIIILYYLGIPTDDSGFPLVPDEINYKQALYYYTRMKMGEAGYKDPIYRIGDIMQIYEKHAARAIAAIKYPSADRMESMINTLTRLIPPLHWYENYFDSNSPEKQRGYLNPANVNYGGVSGLGFENIDNDF